MEVGHFRKKGSQIESNGSSDGLKTEKVEDHGQRCTVSCEFHQSFPLGEIYFQGKRAENCL